MPEPSAPRSGLLSVSLSTWVSQVAVFTRYGPSPVSATASDTPPAASTKQILRSKFGRAACGSLSPTDFDVGDESIADTATGLDHLLAVTAVADCLSSALDPAGRARTRRRIGLPRSHRAAPSWAQHDRGARRGREARRRPVARRALVPTRCAARVPQVRVRSQSKRNTDVTVPFSHVGVRPLPGRGAREPVRRSLRRASPARAGCGGQEGCRDPSRSWRSVPTR